MFAIMIAPLAIPSLVMLLFMLSSLIAPSAIEISEAWRIAVYSGFYAALINYICFIVSYLPVYLVLRMRRLDCRKNLTRTGIGSGIFFGLLFVTWWGYGMQQVRHDVGFEAELLFLFPFFAIIGYLNGWFFGLIAAQKLPEAVQSQANETLPDH